MLAPNLSSLSQVFASVCQYSWHFHQQIILYYLDKAMSIYSGLATREDQTNYNKLLTRLITTMQDHILQLCNGVINSLFSSKYTKIIAKMQTYQQHKYLPPKYTTFLKPLEDAMKSSLVLKAKHEIPDFNIKLQAVQQEQESEPKVLNKYKTQLSMKKTFLKNKKIFHKQPLNQSSIREKQKESDNRNQYVFSEQKPRVEYSGKKIERFKPRQTFGHMNYKSRDLSSSSGSRNLIKNKHTSIQPIQRNEKSSSYKNGNSLMKILTEAANKPY